MFSHYIRNIQSIPTIMLVLIAFSLSGCFSPPHSELAEEFGELVGLELPVVFDVERIEVRENYASPGNPPHVEDMFALPPAQALQSWVSENIKATGRGGRTLVIAIDQASVIEEEVIMDTKPWEVWADSEMHSYDAELEVSLDVYEPPRLMSLAEVNIAVSRNALQPKDAELDEKDRLYQEITERLMDGFEKEALKQIERHFGDIIITD